MKNSARHVKEWASKPLNEAGLLFLLLLPFFLFFLRQDGVLHALGFVYLTALCAYMVFWSPHLITTPEARRSLLEVPALVVWTMVVIWVIWPWGPLGKSIGNVLIGFTVFFILVVSPWLNRDSLEDWGLGSPGNFWKSLCPEQSKIPVLVMFFVGNIALTAATIAGRDIFLRMAGSFLKKSFGIRLADDLSQWVLTVGFLVILNFLFSVTRFDNISKAARIVGLYLLIGGVVVFSGLYLYIYPFSGGYVEFRPLKGLAGVGGYILWGTLQELLFLSYFNTRIRKGISSPYLSALLTAVIFSIYHLTCYTLMFLCFLVGIIWALIFQAAPNLMILGFSHGMSGGFGSAFEVKGMEMFKINARVGPFNMGK